MEVSSQRVTGSRSWARTLYLVLASLIFLGIFLQGFFIGSLLFAGMSWGARAHSMTGMLLLLLALLLMIAGFIARLPRNMHILNVVFLVLMLIQMMLPSLKGSVPLVSALHPANALLLIGLNTYLILRATKKQS
ncbi:MAG TPA: hypothetical protein VHD63_07435 [Ktedonobacteraceae bacterium]|nr:hypothetical protein [Ktedonobacteraceae bacterium]